MKQFYNSNIPRDWNDPEFKEIFNFLSTFSFSRDQLTNDITKDLIQNIHYGDIHTIFESQVLDFEEIEGIPYVCDGLITKNEIGRDDFPLLKDGDLVIADASEDYKGLAEAIELKNIGTRKVVGGLHTFVARDIEGCIKPGFKTYLLKHPQVVREIRRIATGFSVFGISKYNLSKIKLALPSGPEQLIMAEIFSTWDRAIDLTTHLISAKEQQNKWLMQQLLTGKKRLKGFKNSSWKTQSLENFIRPISREVPKPTKPYLGIGIRSHGKGTFLKFDELPEKNAMESFYVVKTGDLIVNITFAWEQAIAIATTRDDGALASHRFPTYIFQKGKGNRDFFKFFIVQSKMKKALELISPGGAGRNRVMNKKDFIKLEFLFPEFEEQTRIAEVLINAEKEFIVLQKKFNLLKEQKKGLMQILLTGKKRITK